MDRRGLKRVAAVAANTFRETVRERVLYSLVFFALLMIVSGLLLRDLSLRYDAKVVKDLGLATIELFGVAIAILVGVGLVAKEVDRKSLYPLLAKPLGRGEFLVGRYAGLAATLFVNVALMTIGLYLALVVAALRPPARAIQLDVNLLQAVLGIYLGLLVVVAVGLLFSCLTSSTLAALLTLGVVIAGRFSDVVRNLREVVPGAPAWLTTAVYHALPNFANFDLKARVVHGHPVAAADLALIAAYAASYCVVLVSLAVFAFRRRDLL